MLNATEKDVFGLVLKQACEEMFNACCNDVSVSCTAENQAELIQLINVYAEDDDQRDHLLKSAVPGKQVYFQDWLLIKLLMRKLSMK
jgi:hypothetical protein